MCSKYKNYEGVSAAHLSLDTARALRIAELVNDYQTLLVHIVELIGDIPSEKAQCCGYKVLVESHIALQNLTATSYDPEIASRHGPVGNGQTAQLRKIILDASARRHQAHRIYLRAVAAKSWLVDVRGTSQDLTTNKSSKKPSVYNRILRESPRNFTVFQTRMWPRDYVMLT
ncbi:hypothetical protein BDV59DRAFT_149927 [Aspergillus ambiguus]|uniref:uncharacterized protein n=1 Tax=Aspergillus ambiguus TaxID=176160 RepID=UPI003CCD3187